MGHTVMMCMYTYIGNGGGLVTVAVLKQFFGSCSPVLCGSFGAQGKEKLPQNCFKTAPKTAPDNRKYDKK